MPELLYQTLQLILLGFHNFLILVSRRMVPFDHGCLELPLQQENDKISVVFR